MLPPDPVRGQILCPKKSICTKLTYFGQRAHGLRDRDIPLARSHAGHDSIEVICGRELYGSWQAEGRPGIGKAVPGAYLNCLI